MTTRARLALAIMALVALVALVYSPLRSGVFVWDDHSLIEDNQTVQRGSVAEIFGQPFWAANPLSDAHPSYYRPITTLTLRADYAVAAGPDAQSFHTSNLIMHLLAAIALVLAALRLGAGLIASLLAAAAWALHPRTTEAVAWVSGRADLLAGLAALIAIGVWPWYGDAGDEDQANDETRERRERRRAGLAGIAIFVGLLSKEVAIAAVVGIAIGTALGARPANRESERRMRVARRLLWIGVPLVLYAGLRFFVMRGAITSRLAPLGVGRRAVTVLEAIGRYVVMTFDAWHPTTSIGLIGAIDTGSVVFGALAIVAFAMVTVRAVVRMRRARAALRSGRPPVRRSPANRPQLAALAGMGLTSLGLVVHVVPISLASGVAADRLLYLPLASLALALAVGSSTALARVPRSGRIAIGAFVGLLVATFVPITRARAGDYTDELRFRLVAAEHAHPGNTSVKSGLANVLRTHHATALACELHSSVRKTLERTGQTKTQRYLRALENLGSCYAALGRYEDAEQTYELAERLDPNQARIHMEYGYLRLHTFDVARAEAELRRALELAPDLEPARATLAALPALRVQLARFDTDKAREEDPVGWARLLASIGRIPDATAAWTAIVMAPNVDGGVAWEGLQHLLANADIETAQRTVAAGIAARVPGDTLPELARRRLAERLKEDAHIEELRPRIEALASSEDRR